MTASQCMEKAGLNWSVDLHDCYVNINGEFVKTNYNKIPVRSDNKFPFKAVGNRYVPFQNTDVFSFMDSVIDDSNSRYAYAGTFENGALVYITIALGDDIKIGDDNVVPYFTIINSHNGSTSIKAITTPIRITCSNTLQLAVKNAVSSFSFGTHLMLSQKLHKQSKA